MTEVNWFILTRLNKIHETKVAARKWYLNKVVNTSSQSDSWHSQLFFVFMVHLKIEVFSYSILTNSLFNLHSQNCLFQCSVLLVNILNIFLKETQMVFLYLYLLFSKSWTHSSLEGTRIKTFRNDLTTSNVFCLFIFGLFEQFYWLIRINTTENKAYLG